MAQTFGEYFGVLRRRTDRSLREFCELHGFDPGNVSKMERGKLAPPRGTEKLTEYATALGIEPGGDEWYQFFDLAAASRGEIPSDLLEDEDVVNQLPVLFRTLRGERVPEEELHKLLEMIRRT